MIKGPKNINIKKREIDALFEDFSWEAMPYKLALAYLDNIKDELMDYYANYRAPLR